MDRILLEGARLTLGPEAARGAAQFAKNEDSALDPVRFLRVLEETYGEAGGRGLMLRIGRAGFRAVLHGEEGTEFRSVAFRMLPSQHRVEQGLRMLAGFLSNGVPIQVMDENTYWLWQAGSCPVCKQRAAARGDVDGLAAAEREPYCYWMVGLIQEFASWAGGGKFYRVVEQSPCRFAIEKKPLD